MSCCRGYKTRLLRCHVAEGIRPGCSDVMLQRVFDQAAQMSCCRGYKTRLLRRHVAEGISPGCSDVMLQRV